MKADILTISFHQRVHSLYNISIAGLLLTVEVTSEGLSHIIGELILGGGVGIDCWVVVSASRNDTGSQVCGWDWTSYILLRRGTDDAG